MVNRMVWIDLETTGLDEKREHAQIIEIACIITDAELQELESVSQVIGLPFDLTGKTVCEEWAYGSHTKSGLLEAAAGGAAVHTAYAEEQITELIMHASAGLGPTGARLPLCGNTIGFDRRWLDRHMPAITEALHYRSIDVSTVKELARLWYPDAIKAWEAAFPKEGAAHRALADLRMSIEELKFYQRVAFRGDVPGPVTVKRAVQDARNRLGR